MKVIETEHHFLLVCPNYRDIRLKYLKFYYYTWPSLTKFEMLMSLKTKNAVLSIAK